MAKTFRKTKRPATDDVRAGREILTHLLRGRQMSSSKRAAPIGLEAGDAGDVAAGKTIAVVATGGQLTVAHREEVVETGGRSKRGHNSREKSTGYHNRPRRGLEFDYLDIGYLGGAVRLHNRQVCNPAMRIGRS
jgi:hypothetical protein